MNLFHIINTRHVQSKHKINLENTPYTEKSI